MNYQDPQNSSGDPYQLPSAGHIYVNGFGFVEQDPRIRENAGIRRSATVTGLILVAIFVVTALSIYPINLALQGLFVFLSTNIPYSYGLNAAFMELRELLCYLCAILVPLALASVFLRTPRPKELFRAPVSGMTVYSVLIGLGVMVLLTLLTDAVETILIQFHILELTPDYILPLTPTALVLYLIRLTLLPAVFEEILFRGILLRALRRFGDSFALVVSTFAFGLIHYSFTKDVSGFVMGLVLGYFVVRSGSVIPAMLTRFLVLLIPLSFQMLQHLLPMPTFQTTAYLVQIVLILAALVAYIHLCRREGNAFILSQGNTEGKISTKLRTFFTSVPMVIATVLWLLQILRHVQFIG